MKYKKLLRQVNGQVIEVFEPEKHSLLTKITAAILLLAAIYLFANFCILYGINKERSNKVCVGVTEMEDYRNTLKTAEAICVDIQRQQMGEIKNGYNASLKLAEEEAKKWKGIYTQKLKESTEASSSVSISASSSEAIIK
jgi:hypothetical protein